MKVTYLGKPRTIFNVGKFSFPAGVEVEVAIIPKAILDMKKDFKIEGYVAQPIPTKSEEPKSAEEEKAKVKRRRIEHGDD